MKIIKDGLITEVKSTANHIDFKFQCAAVESGELNVSINPLSDGRLYLHFSGLSSKTIEVNKECANGVEITVTKEDSQLESMAWNIEARKKGF